VALLVLGKHGCVEPLSLQFFAQMNQLTPAESVVLAALCEGLRPAQVAARGGVALSTIRSQIGSIRQKTRAQSVSHVVRLVQTLPPVVPALNVCRSDCSASH
jgi:DNA-binding CsgD family transcriptional regulator